MSFSAGSSRVRLVDIAQRVGVSKRVVGSVLNDYGSRSARVSAARREEILRVAAELGYSRNLTAATLAGRGSRKIGVFIDSYAPACIWRILISLEEQASLDGYCLLIGQAHDSPRGICERYQSYMQHNVEACVCFAHDYPGHDGLVREFFLRQDNVVFLDAPNWPDCWSVDIDRQAGLRQSLQHLLAGGRRKIGFWLYGEKVDFAKHNLGYQQRLTFFEQSGLPAERLFFRSDAAAFAEELIELRLDAVFAPNDLHAARLAGELMNRAVSIPEQMAILGHDDDPFAQVYHPPLSSISQNEKAAGIQLWKLVKQRIGNGQKKAEKIKVQTKLIARESSAAKK